MRLEKKETQFTWKVARLRKNADRIESGESVVCFDGFQSGKEKSCEKKRPRDFFISGKNVPVFERFFFRLWLWIAFAVYKRDFSSFLGALIDNELSNTVSGDWERTCRSLKVSGRESTQRKCSEAQTVLQENTDYRTKSQYLCVHLPAISQIKPNYFFL